MPTIKNAAVSFPTSPLMPLASVRAGGEDVRDQSEGRVWVPGDLIQAKEH